MGGGGVDAGQDAGADAGALDAGVDAGRTFCPSLTFAADNEPTVTPPLTLAYPAFGFSGDGGQGTNGSAVGYSLGLAYVDGGQSVWFGVSTTSVNEGVPWDDDAGTLTDGIARAWAIDVGSSNNPTYRMTLTFDAPVTGLKFAITDLDFISETVQVSAFPVASGGTAITLTDHGLAAPTTFPSLARGVLHNGNDAYIVSQTKVQSLTNGRYGVAVAGGVTDQTGTVLFAFDEAQAIQRVEVVYTGSGTGVWLTNPVFNNMCGP
jgi:hypothetical protein